MINLPIFLPETVVASFLLHLSIQEKHFSDMLLRSCSSGSSALPFIDERPHLISLVKLLSEDTGVSVRM